MRNIHVNAPSCDVAASKPLVMDTDKIQNHTPEKRNNAMSMPTRAAHPIYIYIYIYIARASPVIGAAMLSAP